MGMVAAYQQVAPAALATLLAKPALLEDFLFPEPDSYGVNGYGDVSVDVSAAGMSSWQEIDPRVRGLLGEVQLRDGTSLPVKDVQLTRELTRWRDSAGPQDRAHAAIASIRLVPPLSRRLLRTWHRTGEFVLSTALAAGLLTVLSLHLQKKAYGHPPWVLAVVLLGLAVVVLAKAILNFRRERVVVAYHHRRSKRIGASKPEPIDIDKSWEMIEVALAGFAHEDAEPIRKAVLGGREIEGTEVGFGPARYLSAEDVAAVASSFSRVPVEAFAERCAPGLRDYVALHLRNLQSYYLDAAAHGHAMIGYYC